MPEKDYTYGEQLLLEAVKSTYGIPTVGLLAAGFAGFKFIAPKLDWFLKGLEDVTADIIQGADDLYQDAILRGETIRRGAEQTIAPVATFKSDSLACYVSSKVKVPALGRVWVPAVSSVQFNVCMGQKGYAGDTVERYFNMLP